MKIFLTLLRKDWRLILNNPREVLLYSFLGLMWSVISALGIGVIVFPAEHHVGLVLLLSLIILVFNGSLYLSRALAPEQEFEALNFYFVRKIDLSLFYLSRTLIHALIFFPSFILFFFTLSLLLSVTINQVLLFLLIGLLFSFSYSALCTLLAGLTSVVRVSSLLLPLILIPLIFPLFFAALESSLMVLSGSPFRVFDFWFSLLCFLSVLYPVLGINLYPRALQP